MLQHVPKFSDKVDTTIRHVGNNLGHDLYIDNVRTAKRISVFPNNPIRKAIIRAAESISRGLGLVARKTLDEKQSEDIELKVTQ